MDTVKKAAQPAHLVASPAELNLSAPLKFALTENAKTFAPQTLSAAEAATYLGVTRFTIYRWIKRKILRPVPYLRHKRISLRQLNELLNGGRSAA